MPFLNSSLFDTSALTEIDLLSLFSEADRLKRLSDQHGGFVDPRRKEHHRPKVVCCLFFEPSTRTRMSFQMASYRLGHQVLTMELNSGSSLSKGETYGDTVLNVAAMKPDAMVIRYGRSTELDELLPRLPLPVINAGNGTMAHPTQALLDAYTIHSELGSARGQRVLIVGDIAHSRVARSNFDVLKKLGAEVAVCGPASLLPEPEQTPGIRTFQDLDEAISWATVYMGLRIQLERHDASDLDLKSMEDYHSHFGLNQARLQRLAKGAIIMHPGPINHGVEFSADVMKDSRNRVLSQVTNGVLMRAALLSKILGDSPAETKSVSSSGTIDS